MGPHRSVSLGLLGIAIGIFGLSVSIVGLALTQVYPGNVNVGTLVGAVIAFLGLIVTLFALSIKE